MVEQTTPEVSRLRACINDLIGIVALPAVWSGSTPAEIARTLVDTLAGMIQPDFIYLRLNHSAGEPPVQLVRRPFSDAAGGLPLEIEKVLQNWQNDHSPECRQVVRNLPGDEDLSIIPVPLGLEGGMGILAAGSRRPNFPLPTEKLLLSVAANQATVWLQGARLLSDQKRVAEELDQSVACRAEELLTATKELQNRDRKIRRLIDSNIIGIVIWDLDGRLLDANDAFLRMVGYEREDLQVGLRWFDMTPPEWQEAHARYEAEELAETGMMQPREKEYFSKDGSRVPVLIGAACFEGQPNQGVAYIVDLSQQKRAEKALRRSEAYLAEAQKQTHTGSCAIDGASRETVYWSDEMFRLFDVDPQCGPPRWDQFVEQIHPQDRDKFRQASDSLFRRKVPCDIEYRIVKPDGAVRHMHGIGHPVVNSSGELIEVLGTMIDITERKQAQENSEKLRQAQIDLAHVTRVSTMGELTASLAHEIKQPIGAAVTNAEACIRLIERSEPDLSEAREAALEMIRDARRAADIIDRVRLLYQKGSGLQEHVDLNLLIHEMAGIMDAEATRHGVTMRIESRQGLPFVVGDRVQLQQALMNLMLNGIEAMPGTGGELRIETKMASDHQLLVSVSDTGTGIPAENLDKIFNAFFTTKTQGTGLGLAITRSIIQSHEGHIWVSSKSGAGTTFSFTLPVAGEVTGR